MATATQAATVPLADRPQFAIITKALGTEGPEDKPRFTAIASSTITDRAGDEITLAALERMADRFREGLTIFVDHNKSAYNAFGTTDTAEIRSGGQDKTGHQVWDLHISGVVNAPSDRAMELWRSMDGGYVKFGASIGAFVLDHERKKGGGLRIDDIDVYEASIVGVPMNQRSWAYKAAKAIKSFYGEPEQEDAAMGDTIEKSGDLPAAETPEPVVAKSDDCTCEGDCTCDAKSDAATEVTDPDPVLDDKSIESADADPKEAELGAPETAADAVTPETAPTDGQEAPDDEATPETASEATDKALVVGSEDMAGLVRNVRKLAGLIVERDEKIAALSDSLRSVTTERDQLAEENEDAKAVIERVLSMPLRRKAFSDVEGLTKRLPDFLDPRVKDYLAKVSEENQK